MIYTFSLQVIDELCSHRSSLPNTFLVSRGHDVVVERLEGAGEDSRPLRVRRRAQTTARLDVPNPQGAVIAAGDQLIARERPLEASAGAG